jgi:hypothetical protein
MVTATAATARLKSNELGKWANFVPKPNRSSGNEYLDFYIEVMEELTAFGWLNSEGQMDLPSNRREGFVNVLGSYMDNCITPLRRMYSWAVPTDEAIAAIANASPFGVVEVGAGTGYWAMLLRHRGVDVLAYDRTPVAGQLWDRWPPEPPPAAPQRAVR